MAKRQLNVLLYTCTLRLISMCVCMHCVFVCVMGIGLRDISVVCKPKSLLERTLHTENFPLFIAMVEFFVLKGTI